MFVTQNISHICITKNSLKILENLGNFGFKFHLKMGGGKNAKIHPKSFILNTFQ